CERPRASPRRVPRRSPAALSRPARPAGAAAWGAGGVACAAGEAMSVLVEARPRRPAEPRRFLPSGPRPGPVRAATVRHALVPDPDAGPHAAAGGVPRHGAGPVPDPAAAPVPVVLVAPAGLSESARPAVADRWRVPAAVPAPPARARAGAAPAACARAPGQPSSA